MINDYIEIFSQTYKKQLKASHTWRIFNRFLCHHTIMLHKKLSYIRFFR